VISCIWMNVCIFFIWFSLFSFWYPEELLATGVFLIPGIDGVRMEFGNQAHDQKTTGRWRCLNKVVYTFLHHISPAPCDLIAKTPQIPTQIWSNMIKVDMQAYSDILGSPWQADQNQIFRMFPYSSRLKSTRLSPAPFHYQSQLRFRSSSPV
jgi:hypothetical protein